MKLRPVSRNKRFSDNLSAPCKFQWRPVSACKQPDAQLFECRPAWRDERAKRSRFAGKRGRSRVHTYYTCIQPRRSLVRSLTLEFSTPAQDRFECLFSLSLFYPFFARLQQTRSIFPPPDGMLLVVWRVFTDELGDSRGNFRRDDRQKGK